MTRNPPRARRTRGQALVELAIGLLVFITVLIFGIHFAEVGYISVKVTEASHSALLDSTGKRLHQWPGNTGPSSNSIVRSGLDADARYRDFDSRSLSTGSTSPTQVFTRARNLQVRCQPNGGPGWDPSPFTSAAYSDNGGMTCTSDAQVTAFQLPRRFMENDGGGFFKKQHYEPTPIRVCALGRAGGGGCAGELTSMLDDWGLSGPAESRLCLLIPDFPGPCANTAYWRMAGSVFLYSGAGMGVSGSQMAQEIVGAMPFPFFFGAENAFWLSAPGEEVLFMQPLPSEGWKLWATTPGGVPAGLGGVPYTVAYVQRDGCFLGKDCPP